MAPRRLSLGNHPPPPSPWETITRLQMAEIAGEDSLLESLLALLGTRSQARAENPTQTLEGTSSFLVYGCVP